MRKLSNTEVELKKGLLIKKCVYFDICRGSFPFSFENDGRNIMLFHYFFKSIFDRLKGFDQGSLSLRRLIYPFCVNTDGWKYGWTRLSIAQSIFTCSKLAIKTLEQKVKDVQELGLESLQLCRWYRKLCLFYKVLKNEHPKYLFNLIHVRSLCYMLQELRAIFSLLRQSITFSKILFFPYAIIKWNNRLPS